MHKLPAVFLAAALLAIGSVACSETSPSAPTPTPAPLPGASTVRISGRLVDYQTGRTVGGTTMQWRPLIRNVSSSYINVTAGPNGAFEVDLPTTELLGNFLFQIQTGPINFQSGTVRAPSKHLETDIFVNAGPCAGRYGYVFDAVTRQPIPGARVLRAGIAITDDNGYYRIDIGCEPRDALYWGIGTTTISVSHPSYQGTFELDGRRESTSFSGVRRLDFALDPL